MFRPSRSHLWFAVVFVLVTVSAFGLLSTYRNIGLQADGRFLIPTGQILSPAGTHIEVNDRPLGMAVSPDHTTLAVATGSNFNPKAVHLIDLASNRILQTVAVGDSFVGIAFSNDGNTLYVGGGSSNNDVKILRRNGSGVFAQSATVSIPGASPSGLALTPDGAALYVACNLRHTVAVVNTQTLTYTEVPVGTYPYTVVMSPDGSRAYVSNWGGRPPRAGDTTDGQNSVVVDPRTGIPSTGTVSVIDTATQTVKAEIDTGLHPSGMALRGDGAYLFVANANSDTVTVIDTGSLAALGDFHVAPRKKDPLGSSPDALAVSPDGSTLYVANAANNAIAVVNITGQGKQVVGYIPTGWYPTAVNVSPDGTELFVASGYGFGSLAPKANPTGRSYADRKGIVSRIPIPNAANLAAFTKQVRQNNRSLPPVTSALPAASPIPMSAGQSSPIKHVLFVIKENRTYDQVFGDVKQGNGDPSLAIFDKTVTPNHHALAQQFVLMDNYYGPGDQSALGHRWCTQGYASDWVFKYSNARNDQNPMLFAPTEFLWDTMKAAHRSVRSYGERGLNKITPANATWTDLYKDYKSGANAISIVPQAVILGLRDVYSPHGAAFEQRVTDQWRLDQFLIEFRDFEKNNNLPELTVLLLPNDHTNGTSPGYPTPRAQVADNDLAIGRLVDTVSHSVFWKDTAIFMTEDDSQDGLDHVDGHRTVGLIVSPYTKRGAVDSSFYTIINMYRTMKQILGLPPLNQFELAAEPMFSIFTNTPDFTPYSAQSISIALDEMNPPLAATTGLQRKLAQASLKMDFSEPDAADPKVLNRAIWHSVKGFSTPYGSRSASR